MAKRVVFSVRRALVGAALSVALAACATLGVATPANAATVNCGWPRCTVYFTKAETNGFAYYGSVPSAPSATWSGIWYIALMTHRGFAIQYANRGMCIGFNLSALPWEGQGLFGYYC